MREIGRDQIFQIYCDDPNAGDWHRPQENYEAGYRKGLKESQCSPPEGKQRVVCAANRNGDLLVLGARHFDMTMNRTIELIDPDDRLCHGDWEQGFIDQHGEFLTREEAWVVAEAAGQIIRRVGGDGVRLYSENLY